MARRPFRLLLTVAAIVIAVWGMVSPRTTPDRSPSHLGRAALQSVRLYGHLRLPGGTTLESRTRDDEHDDGIADDDDAQLDVAACPSSSAIIRDVVHVVFVEEAFRSSSGHKHGTASRAPPSCGRV
jgi:hypothetical protein